MMKRSISPDKSARKILLISIIVASAFILTFCSKKTTSPEEQLLAPSNLQITLIENNKIQLSWQDNSTNETKFLIARKVGTFDWFENYGEVEANITTFPDEIPTNSDTVYSYRIRAFDGENYSAYSYTITWFSENSAPTNLQLEQIAQDSIRLTWQDNSVGEQHFRIDRKISNQNWQENYKIIEPDTTSYIDYNPSLYDTCYYKVFAVCGNSYSDSTQNYFIPFLPAPSDLEIDTLSATSVKLTWQDNCDREDGYIIYKRLEETEWNIINVPANTEEWTDENVIPGIVNYYKVCAYIGDDHSGYIEADINTLPAPSNLQIEQLNVHTFKLDWDDNSNFEQGFKIDRKIDEEEWVNEIGNVDPNITTWTDSTLGRNYDVVYYRVYGYYEEYNSTKIESNSNIVFPAPTNLTYQKLTISSIKLNWTDNSNGEDGFNIDKKVGANEWQLDYVIIGENIEEWTDENAEINETIIYRIYAYCGNNISASIETDEIDNTFPAPSNLAYQKLTISSIILNWTDNSIGEDGFKIDKKVGENEWQLEYAILGENIEEWTDENAEINEIIQYRVYAYCVNNISYSVETGEIDNSIPVPSNLTYQKLTISSIILNWTDNSIGENGFKIDKKVGENEWQLDYAIVGENIVEWTDENAEINEIIQYRVYAYCGNNISNFIETGEIDNNIPAPSNLIYDILSITSIKLNWSDNSIGEEGFKIDKKVRDENWQIEYATLNENTTEWTDENVDLINNSYFYRIYSFYEDYISSKPEIEIFNTFTKTFGGSVEEHGYSGSQAYDGGFIITGYTFSYGVGNSDIWLIKTDALGNEEWNRTFGGSDWDYGKSVSPTYDGGFVITGYTQSSGAVSYSIVRLIKTDANGIEEWNKTFTLGSRSSGNSVSSSDDGGFIITGSIVWGNHGDVWLIKTDANGIEEWNRTFGGTTNETGLSVCQTNDGGFIITGQTSYGSGGYDVWLIKTDAYGNEEWNKTFGGSDDDFGRSGAQTDDGGYIITGYTYSFGSGESDVWLIKTDSQGNEEWNRTFGASESDYGFSVSQSEDGGFIITGLTKSYGAGEQDVWLIKTDAYGYEEWNRTFGGSDNERGSSVSNTYDGGFIIIGYTESYGAGEDDVWLIKTDSQGNVE